MAQKVNIILVDDIDSSEANETVNFGLDGASYEIDLTDEHAQELRTALEPYVNAGRKAGGSRRGGRRNASTPAPAATGPSAKEIRDWARENGWDVPDRGRVSAEVRAAYDTDH